MNKKLKYKKAEPEDLVIVAKLADSIWKKYYPSIISRRQIDFMLQKMYSAESLLEQMHIGHQFTLVYLNKKPVGYYSVSSKDHINYFLHKFYIATGNQKKGIGTQILTFLLTNLINAESIELTVNRQNYKAINFYFKNGFVIKKTADFDIGHGYFMNDFVMIKQL